MTIFWKGAAALSLAITGMTMTAAPAQAHDRDYRAGWRDGHRDNWRGYRDYRSHRDWRRDRRDWRRHHAYRNQWRDYRRHCWTEWRYSPYSHRDIRVRICR